VLIERYAESMMAEWNAFVAGSKNGTFLFDRGYMDYHADRFEDHSLVVRDDAGIVLALFPANRVENTVISHGGLTYGGFVLGRKMGVELFLKLFGAVAEHLRQAGFCALRYKPVPHIYHWVPAEEDVYALFRYGARLVRVDSSSTISFDEPLRWSKGRRQGLKLAERAKLIVAESGELSRFMLLLASVLADRHDTRPVHGAEEIQLLASRFPSQIRLFEATAEGESVGGVLVYDCGRTVHAQYMAASDAGRQIGALDAIMAHVLAVFGDRTFFDFGISTEDEGRRLNCGLARQKEMFGARTTVYATYEMDL
jgi:hypothetical protein